MKIGSYSRYRFGQLEVHLPVPLDKRNPIWHTNRAYHIKDHFIEIIDLNEISGKVERLLAIDSVIELLNVEHSGRYLPSDGLTFCNIYAHDVAFCLGAYIPRVWWTIEAIRSIKSGDFVPVEYAKTVFEMNANAILGWFNDYGAFFGWKKLVGENYLMEHCDKGYFGVVIARNINSERSGHISIVLPRSLGNDIIGDSLLQSSAGALNRKKFIDRWWESRHFDRVEFWLYEGDI